MIRSSIVLSSAAVSLLLLGPSPTEADENDAQEKNVLIIGRSSLAPPLQELVEAFLESDGRPSNVEPGPFGAPALERTWKSKAAWDDVVMDAWQFSQGSTASPEFPDAVTEFVKKVRDHSPNARIILFPWWLPQNDATNEDVLEVFRRCVDAARPHDIRVATTGPAFQEARLARPDLRIVVSRQDAHPGVHGIYLNACSLFAILTEKSPEGLPATLKLRGHAEQFSIAEDDAKYLQELAWKVYQRERKLTEPVEED